jgi:hypothetical protein
LLFSVLFFYVAMLTWDNCYKTFGVFSITHLQKYFSFSSVHFSHPCPPGLCTHDMARHSFHVPALVGGVCGLSPLRNPLIFTGWAIHYYNVHVLSPTGLPLHFFHVVTIDCDQSCSRGR